MEKVELIMTAMIAIPGIVFCLSAFVFGVINFIKDIGKPDDFPY